MVLMADASVDGPSIEHKDFHFIKKYIGLNSNDNCVTIDRWLSDTGFSAFGDKMLQMDIEGAEYEVLLGMTDDQLRSFRVMIIEFHDFHNCYSKFASKMMLALVTRLSRFHQVVHVHPNNCCGAYHRDGLVIPRVIEVTYLRRDRSSFTPASFDHYPIKLDARNKPGLSDVRLSPHWF